MGISSANPTAAYDALKSGGLPSGAAATAAIGTVSAGILAGTVAGAAGGLASGLVKAGFDASCPGKTGKALLNDVYKSTITGAILGAPLGVIGSVIEAANDSSVGELADAINLTRNKLTEGLIGADVQLWSDVFE